MGYFFSIFMTTQKYHVKYNMPSTDNLIEGILLCGELYVLALSKYSGILASTFTSRPYVNFLISIAFTSVFHNTCKIAVHPQ